MQRRRRSSRSSRRKRKTEQPRESTAIDRRHSRSKRRSNRHPDLQHARTVLSVYTLIQRYSIS